MYVLQGMPGNDSTSFSGMQNSENIWLQLQKWITRKLCIPFKLNNYHILFGTDIKESNYAANLLIIITKFYIYKKRWQKLYPSFKALQREIEKYFKLEQFIFLKNQNNEQYETKWQVWRVYLQPNDVFS